MQTVGHCIDPFHVRHSISVTVVMYHMTYMYEQWRSIKKTENWIQAKCTVVRKMTWQLSRQLPQVHVHLHVSIATGPYRGFSHS